jgi:phospholipid/cholesterol/gamma-HCH transport system substrate-binding protein
VLVCTTGLLVSGCQFDVYDIPLPGGASVGDNPYRVTVEFRDVLDLVPQSVVKVDDVTVGMVEEIELRGYTARTTLELRDDVVLPANAVAEIRQTSLLGEKFVELKSPAGEESSTELQEGDVIPLRRSGNNPEVEEVLGALSLILNGGGIAQLKTITQELNTALDGREGTAKSVLREIRTFMAQLDGGKFQILEALENVNELSKSIVANTDTLDLALKELPSAIESIDSQREDLVKMLQALADLSSTGVRVIKASKQNTIRSLNALAPVLRELDRAGANVPKSLQVALTFPFIDAAVGQTAQAARDLHIGDYTNLSINLQVKPDELLRAVGLTGPDGSLCLPRVGCFSLDDLTEPLRNVLPLPDDPDGPFSPDGPLNPDDLLDPLRDRLGGNNRDGRNDGLLSGGPRGRAAPDGAATDAQLRTIRIDTELAGLLAWGVVPR